jgi:carbon storage regulator
MMPSGDRGKPLYRENRSGWWLEEREKPPRGTGRNQGSMLYLTRKVGESIVINDDIELTVVEVRGKSIKLGMTFPSDVSVYRREVYDRIQAEKQGSAPGSGAAGEDAAGGFARAASSGTASAPSTPGRGESGGQDEQG